MTAAPPQSYAPVAQPAPMALGGPPRGRAAASDDQDAFATPPPAPPPMAARREAKKGKVQTKAEEKPTMLEAERSIADAPARAARSASPGVSAYHAQLAALARELDAQGRGRADAAAIRVLRQRLTEWCEDVRSTGANSDLASAVEQLVQRLSAALAAATNLAGETIAIAAELTRLANGAVRPEAFQHCRDMPDPALTCGPAVVSP